MKKETLQAFFRNKRNLVILIVLIFCIVAVGIYAIAARLHTSQEEEPASAQYGTELVLSVSGMHDWEVEEGAEQVDFLEGVTWDDSVVKEVTYDDSGVDLSKVGEYELIYVIHGSADSAEFSDATKKVNVRVVAKKGAEKATGDGTEVMEKEDGATSGIQDQPLGDTGKAPAVTDKQSTSSTMTGRPSQAEGSSKPDASFNQSSPGEEMPSQETTQHVHTWVYVSTENSGHMEYGAECRIHGSNGGEPMFFRTLNDLYLHQMADGCMSSWGTGFKGLAFKYCSGCGEEVITGHVHDFGTIEKQSYLEKVVCKCGMAFTAGKDYTALDSWNTHVEIYTSNGEPLEEHNSYQTTTDSVLRYEATKTCTCGWRPVDSRPVY